MARSLELASVAKWAEWWIFRSLLLHLVATCCWGFRASPEGANGSVGMVWRSCSICFLCQSFCTIMQEQFLFYFFFICSYDLVTVNCQQSSQTMLKLNHTVTMRHLMLTALRETPGGVISHRGRKWFGVFYEYSRILIPLIKILFKKRSLVIGPPRNHSSARSVLLTWVPCFVNGKSLNCDSF